MADYRYLTKSKFQLAMECPTKLYYCDKSEYSNLRLTDSFLQALAESGFQVAALAKAYYPDGIDIATLDDQQAIAETNRWLEKDEVVLFEAAFLYDNLFIRSDILIKKGDHLTLIEVKSKSISHEDKTPFFTLKGAKAIISDWQPYVLDVAFQKFVLSKCYPEMQVSSYLMLVDKDSLCPSDGLNQKFHITKDDAGCVKVIASSSLTPLELKQKILRKVNVDDEVNFIFYEMKFRDGFNFSEYIAYLSTQYRADVKIPPVLGKVCKSCEFKLDPKHPDSSLKSGFNECWSSVCSLQKDEATILEVWNFHKADKLIKQGIYRISQLNESDIEPAPDKQPGLSNKQRQWMQIEKVIQHCNKPYMDSENLWNEMNHWIYPLHFIDFETAMPAIPFNKNQKPCSGLAFQFSHHMLRENGLVEHVDQFLDDSVGKNPNLNFIRALKNSLENDAGTIFRYAMHENTYLNVIYSELEISQEIIPDKNELMDFIQQISQPIKKNQGKWKPGLRNMVDLCELVKRYYYDPFTRGSNSIKKVFPAILQQSKWLQAKYSKPIYGASNGIKSLNFRDKQWIKIKNEKIVDPYELLPKLFTELTIDDEQIDLLFHDNQIKEGGSASIAYARMQFTEMSEKERDELKKALLQYCELDTLAMVMIVEAWKDWMLNPI